MGSKSSTPYKMEDDQFRSGAYIRASWLCGPHQIFVIAPLMEVICGYASTGFCDLPDSWHRLPSNAFDSYYKDINLHNPPIDLCDLWPSIKLGTMAYINSSVPCLVVGKYISHVQSSCTFELIFPEPTGGRLNRLKNEYGDLAASFEFMHFPDPKSCDCQPQTHGEQEQNEKIADIWKHERACVLRQSHEFRFGISYHSILSQSHAQMRVRSLTVSLQSVARRVRRRDGRMALIICEGNMAFISFAIANSDPLELDMEGPFQMHDRNYPFPFGYVAKFYSLSYELFAGEAIRRYYSHFVTPFRPQHTLGF